MERTNGSGKEVMKKLTAIMRLGKEVVIQSDNVVLKTK
jgi:predicted ABC-type ATPase